MHGWDSLMASPPAGPVPQSLTTHHRNWLLRLITLAPAVANAASLPTHPRVPLPSPLCPPIQAGVGGVVKGWEDGVASMQLGETARLLLPWK